jgi:hypothetical protein
MSDETRNIEETVEEWAKARLEALAAEAGELAALFYERAARERANRPRSQWGRLGVRVRSARASRSAPGAFAIEWFTRRWANKTAAGAQTFTSYIRRGTGDRYSRSALAGVAQPWELAIADALEDRFAEIRCLARSVSRVRMAFRQHAKLERMMCNQVQEHRRVPEGAQSVASNPSEEETP